MADGKLRMNISKRLDVSMLFRWTKVHQPVYHYHKGGTTHVDDVQHAGMHAETRNVRSRKVDDRHDDDDGDDRWSGLLVSRIIGGVCAGLNEAGAMPGVRLLSVSCLTAARPRRGYHVTLMGRFFSALKGGPYVIES